MEIVEIIVRVLIGFLIISVVVILVITTLTINPKFSKTSKLLNIRIKVLEFNLDGYSAIRTILDKTLETICKEEDISIFHKTIEEINIKEKDRSEWAIGRYIYTTSPKAVEVFDETIQYIKETEDKYNKPYADVLKLFNIKSSWKSIEDIKLPKILLATEELKSYGRLHYHKTFFHELGHHFAVKNIGEHNEKDADEWAYKLIVNRLPEYFQLLFEFDFSLRLDIDEIDDDKIIELYDKILELKDKEHDTIN